MLTARDHVAVKTAMDKRQARASPSVRGTSVIPAERHTAFTAYHTVGAHSFMSGKSYPIYLILPPTCYYYYKKGTRPYRTDYSSTVLYVFVRGAWVHPSAVRCKSADRITSFVDIVRDAHYCNRITNAAPVARYAEHTD